jgi:hypothetical protein
MKEEAPEFVPSFVQELHLLLLASQVICHKSFLFKSSYVTTPLGGTSICYYWCDQQHPCKTWKWCLVIVWPIIIQKICAYSVIAALTNYYIFSTTGGSIRPPICILLMMQEFEPHVPSSHCRLWSLSRFSFYFCHLQLANILLLKYNLVTSLISSSTLEKTG